MNLWIKLIQITEVIMSESEFLKAIQEADRLNKEDEQEYINSCKEFAKFIEENNCKQIEVEDE